MLVYNAFTAPEIIAHANAELAASGSTIKLVSLKEVRGNLATAVTNRKGLVALIMCNFGKLSLLSFRGIHRIVNKRSRWTYLINGQANQNLSTIIFNGEEGERYYANIENTLAFLKDMYNVVDDDLSSIVKIYDRISWEAAVNPVIQNNIIDELKTDKNIIEAHDYLPVEDGDSAVLFTLDNNGKISFNEKGSFDLMVLMNQLPSQDVYLTKVSDCADDKDIRVAMAWCIWGHLGDVPVDEDDGETIDQAFLHFEKYTDAHDIWHWLEETFDISIGDDILKGRVTQEEAL